MTTGIHHITAIAADPQANLDFYTGLLGLRLIKRTVNFDDPGTWHFYYGDAGGTPGTVLTFFPWGIQAARGRPGIGQATAISFSVHPDSLGFWTRRLEGRGVRVVEAEGERALELEDPDGIRVRLVAATTDKRSGWAGGSATAVDPAHAVRGFHAVELRQRAAGRTAALMIETLGFREAAPRVPGRLRLQSGAGGPGTFVDLVEDAEAPAGRMGAGAVHHVAWRVPDDARQLELRTLLLERGLSVSDVRDRQYFHSIYFHEPGGALFEAATDGPGFSLDEDPAALGRVLKLPPWLEARRAAIEGGLAPVRFPA